MGGLTAAGFLYRPGVVAATRMAHLGAISRWDRAYGGTPETVGRGHLRDGKR